MQQKIKKYIIGFCFVLSGTEIILSILYKFIVAGQALIIKDPAPMDFIAFYTGSALLAQKPQALYNLNTQLSLQHAIAPITQVKDIFLPFLNPPFVAILFTPLTHLSLIDAYAAWACINTLLLCCICILIYKFLPQKWYKKAIVIICVLTFTPVLTSLLLGQLSILMCSIFLLAVILLKSKREIPAGLILSLGLIKPHFILLPLIILIVQRRGRVLTGFISGATLLTLVSLFIIGWDGLMSYISLLLSASNWNQGYGIEIKSQHSIQSALLFLFNSNSLANIRLPWLVIIITITIATTFILSKKTPLNSQLFSLQLVTLIIATLLISPHTHFHDLTLLISIALIVFYNRFLLIMTILGYLIINIGLFFDIQTHTSTRSIWVVTDVTFMIAYLCMLFRIHSSRLNKPTRSTFYALKNYLIKRYLKSP